MPELFYNISQSGRDILRSTIRSYKPIEMPLRDDLEFLPIYPTELEVLTDFAEADHGMDMAEIKDRWGSVGLRTFRRLHQAGYITAETKD